MTVVVLVDVERTLHQSRQLGTASHCETVLVSELGVDFEYLDRLVVCVLVIVEHLLLGLLPFQTHVLHVGEFFY